MPQHNGCQDRPQLLLGKTTLHLDPVLLLLLQSVIRMWVNHPCYRLSVILPATIDNRI